MAQLTTVLFCVFLTSCAGQPEDAAASANSSENSAHGALDSVVSPSNQVQDDLEVWIDLSVPSLSTLSRGSREAREALRARIDNQQDEVMAQLASLGAEESARIVQVRNAIAVRIPASALPQAQAIPGVVKVRVVKHRKRTP